MFTCGFALLSGVCNAPVVSACMSAAWNESSPVCNQAAWTLSVYLIQAERLPAARW